MRVVLGESADADEAGQNAGTFMAVNRAELGYSHGQFAITAGTVFVY